MFLQGKRKKPAAGLFIFFVFMWLCTVISKSVYTSALPVVSTQMPEQKYIEHITEVQGIVVEGGNIPITALSGLRVENIAVQVGDRVEEGDVVFRVDLEDLEKTMEAKETEITGVQYQINALLENKALADQKKAIAEERAREDYNNTAREKNDDLGRAKEEYAQAEEDLENYLNGDYGYAAGDWEQGKDALEDALQQAAYQEADAQGERDHALEEIQREIEDILFPEAADATLSLYQLELEELEQQLNTYQQVKKQEGYVKAPQGGVITDVLISVGGRVPDAAAVLISDETIPYEFKAVIDSSQKKYMRLGDEVSLLLDGRSREMDVTIEYLGESKTQPGCLETRIRLPEGVGTPGLSGTLTHKAVGEKYQLCLPPCAIYQEELRSYVYVLKEREGILGMEYYVEEITVKVLDYNETWAAVEATGLDEESRIIVSADKEIKKGSIVRWV